jgi:hypothetical protein
VVPAEAVAADVGVSAALGGAFPVVEFFARGTFVTGGLSFCGWFVVVKKRICGRSLIGLEEVVE